MSYVDGFLLAVPTANKDAYIQMARDIGVLYKDYGALVVMECWGDDVPEGKLTSFPKAVKLEAGETVVFSYVIWPSKEVREDGHEKMISDERLQNPDYMTVMDSKRMMYGGFTPIFEM